MVSEKQFADALDVAYHNGWEDACTENLEVLKELVKFDRLKMHESTYGLTNSPDRLHLIEEANKINGA